LKKKNLENKDLIKTVIEELNGDGPAKSNKKRGFWKVIQIPALAILTGLLIGAVLIAATSFTVYDAFKVGFFNGIGTAFVEIGKAYMGLFTGSLGNPVDMISALIYGDAQDVRNAFNPILESLVQATPYIFAGLACALAFRAGLFNICVEGQLVMG
jgi:simple sugar transport system permease protein